MVLAVIAAALVLAALWVIVVALVLAAVVAAGWPAERPPGRPVDPHAAAVAEFSAELADWDRRGRP